jgi:peptide/nickel transport system substrate-binding protein
MSGARGLVLITLFSLFVTLGCQATSWLAPDEPVSTPVSAPPTASALAVVAEGPAPDQAPLAVSGVLSQTATQSPPVIAQSIPSTLPVSFVEAIPADVDLFNPVLTGDTTTLRVMELILPRLVGQDPQSGEIIASGLASSWLWSADGRTITFTLRSDIAWSDGAPVTASDVGFTLAALANPQIASPLAGLVAPLERIELPNSQTLVLHLTAPDCAFLANLLLPILPSHLFAADFSDLRDNAFNAAPTVGAGPFLFAQRQPGESIELVRNPTYWKGAPQIERYVLRVTPDVAERAQLLASGALDLALLDADQAGLLSDTPALRLSSIPVDGYSFLALNLADPTVPLAGVDAAGALQPQPPHPVLGELAVRRAVAGGVDFAAIVAQVYGAATRRPVGYVPPVVQWAIADDLAPIPYDPDAARQALDQAGWIDAAGDGVRERGDSRLQVVLITNNETPQRVRMGELVAEQLAQLGFDVRFETLPFTRSAEIVLGQQFDMAIQGWEQLGSEPARLGFWQARDDLPAAGLNVTSYQRSEVEALLDEAHAAPGCALGRRADLYRQVQRLIHDDIVLIPLAEQTQVWGQGARWQGIAPGPWSLHANVEQWRVSQ